MINLILLFLCRITSKDAVFELRLHLIYLMNDLLHHWWVIINLQLFYSSSIPFVLIEYTTFHFNFSVESYHVLTWKFIGCEQNISVIVVLQVNSFSSIHVTLPSQTFLSGQRFSSLFLIYSWRNFILPSDHNGHLSSELFWEII